MNKIKATLIVVALLVGLTGIVRIVQAQAVTLSSPNGLVADLYKVHNQKRGPFHPGHGALLYKYFEKHLADMKITDAENGW